MKNKGYDISKCCESHTQYIPQTLHEVITHQPKIHICIGCGECCDVEFKPAYLEKGIGIFSKIEYNKKRIYDQFGNKIIHP